MLVSLTCNITEYELELRKNLKEVKYLQDLPIQSFISSCISSGQGRSCQDINDGRVCTIRQDWEKNQQTHWKVKSMLQCKIASGFPNMKWNCIVKFNEELMQASKAGWAFTLSMHACLGEPSFSPLDIKRLQIQILIPGLGLVMTMWSWGSEPVLILPPGWLSPISWWHFYFHSQLLFL